MALETFGDFLEGLGDAFLERVDEGIDIAVDYGRDQLGLFEGSTQAPLNYTGGDFGQPGYGATGGGFTGTGGLDTQTLLLIGLGVVAVVLLARK